MNYWKTELDVLTPKDIEKFIVKHQAIVVPRCDDLWQYYQGKNVKILSKHKASDGNPDNRTPVSYARKIVNTFASYGYRSKFITYKPAKGKDKKYFAQLEQTFKINQEYIKTHRAGRDTGVFGVAYEVLYTDKGEETGGFVEPRFFNANPKEIILLYDYEPEPRKKIGIRYYCVSDNYYKVEVYYKDTVVLYNRTRAEQSGEWEYALVDNVPNLFGDVPIVPYYFGDDCIGIIEPVLPLIDDYDQLLSGSIDEFERFANSYLRLVGMSLGGTKPDDETAVRKWLNKLRRNRVFENLKDKDSVSFLTKDIPTPFVEFMSNYLHGQIHTQSSVPDFMEFKDVSGDAIDRLMFDFENVVSSVEADFDAGLYERIRLINVIYASAGKIVADPMSIVIMHKRNTPAKLRELAETANIMKQAGFSRQAIVGIMPDDVIPDDDIEIKRQEDEAMGDVPDVEDTPPPDPNAAPDDELIEV